MLSIHPDLVEHACEGQNNSMDEVLNMKGICKSFSGSYANDHVDFSLNKGELHCLLGENGAGKTTLMNILYGLYSPDEGEVYLFGEKTDIPNPEKAISKGIGMVHQHFMLFDPMTVYENVILGCEETRFGFLNRTNSEEAIRKLSDECGFSLDLRAKIDTLPIGTRQKVEILKALYRGAKILILDEPTAVLTPQETDELFVILERLKALGTSIVLITHKLRETFAVADRITVMRKGKTEICVAVDDTTPEKLAETMVGRKISLDGFDKSKCIGEEVLTVEDLSTSEKDKTDLRKINFKIHKGEIFGIAGVDGNGQSELVQALVGVLPVLSGSVNLNGDDILKLSPDARMKAGLAVIPEDRNKMGLVPDFTVSQNILLGSQNSSSFSRRGFINWRKVRSYAKSLMKAYDIKPDRDDLPARVFSGGNQQRIIVARELSTPGITLVIAAQPVRGLDIGAAEFVNKQLLKMRDAGAAILLVSTELDDIRALSDTIAVMYEGELVSIDKAENYTESQLGYLMAGKTRMEKAG